MLNSSGLLRKRLSEGRRYFFKRKTLEKLIGCLPNASCSNSPKCPNENCQRCPPKCETEDLGLVENARKFIWDLLEKRKVCEKPCAKPKIEYQRTEECRKDCAPKVECPREKECVEEIKCVPCPPKRKSLKGQMQTCNGNAKKFLRDLLDKRKMYEKCDNPKIELQECEPKVECLRECPKEECVEEIKCVPCPPKKRRVEKCNGNAKKFLRDLLDKRKMCEKPCDNPKIGLQDCEPKVECLRECPKEECVEEIKCVPCPPKRRRGEKCNGNAKKFLLDLLEKRKMYEKPCDNTKIECEECDPKVEYPEECEEIKCVPCSPKRKLRKKSAKSEKSTSISIRCPPPGRPPQPCHCLIKYPTLKRNCPGPCPRPAKECSKKDC